MGGGELDRTMVVIGIDHPDVNARSLSDVC
jgi:hypothetical protein